MERSRKHLPRLVSGLTMAKLGHLNDRIANKERGIEMPDVHKGYDPSMIVYLAMETALRDKIQARAIKRKISMREVVRQAMDDFDRAEVERAKEAAGTAYGK